MNGSQVATAKAGLAKHMLHLLVRFPHLHGLVVALVDLGWSPSPRPSAVTGDDVPALLGLASDIDNCILSYVSTGLNPQDVDALRFAMKLVQTHAAMVAWLAAYHPELSDKKE